MAVITISRASYSNGKAIAGGVARRLGYGCIGDEVLADSAEEFGVDPVKLRRAIEEAPRFWGMSFSTRMKLISCYQSTLARLLQADNVVYHGPAGHLLIQGVSHVLRVYLRADIQPRVQSLMKAENLAAEEALKKLIRQDKERGKWNSLLYSVKTEAHGEASGEESLCDLVIDTGKTLMNEANNEAHEEALQEAMNTISFHAVSGRYRTTTYSANCLKNIELSSRVRAALIGNEALTGRDVNVRAASGSVFVHTRAPEGKREKIAAAIGKTVKSVRDVANVEVTVTEDLFEKYASTYR